MITIINWLLIKFNIAFLTIILLFFNLAFSISLFGQSKDSLSANIQLDSMKTDVFYLKKSPESPQSVDTSLLAFHRYDGKSKDDFLTANLGNLGLPNGHLFSSVFQNETFSVGEQYFSRYHFDYENVPYYLTPIPYSHVTYVTGPREENFLNFSLANQMGKGLYFGTDFQVESAKGTFNNQRSANNHFRVVTSYKTPAEFYSVRFNYIRNKYKIGENGGLVNDFYYEDTTRLDRRILNVNLIDATNFIKTNQFFLDQKFQLFRFNTNSLAWFIDADYSSKQRIYQDKSVFSGYYDYFHIDSTGSFDSVYSKSISLKSGFTIKNDSIGWKINLGAKFLNQHYFDGKDSYDFRYIGPEVEIGFINNTWAFGFLGSFSKNYWFSDFNYNDNAMEFDGFLSYKFRKKNQVVINFTYQNQAPDFIYFRSYSNHFLWKNQFDNQQKLSVSSTLLLNKFRLKAHYQYVNNFVYLTDTLIPFQYASDISTFQLTASQTINYKSLGLDLMAGWQIGNADSVFPLPEFLGRANLFVGFQLFKGVLHVYPGIEASYVSSYFARGYNPANMVFFVQNEKQIDNQLYLDAYISFKIKRARIFVKYQNLNMLFGKYNYFLIAHYPQQDPGLKIGVNWRFYD